MMVSIESLKVLASFSVDKYCAWRRVDCATRREG